MLKAFRIKVDHVVDELSMFRMDFLTNVARRVLPSGYWGHNKIIESVYLTFDDGPHPTTTPRLLELLAEANIKATFFLIGSNAERYPELVEAIYKAGHTIGNHSYSHNFMPIMPAKSLEKEIIKTNEIINEITKKTPKLFRAPYGIMNNKIADCLNEIEMTPVYWGKSPEDWTKVGSERIAKRVLTRLLPGTIIVLHERHSFEKQTTGAAKEIIYKCKDLRYQLEVIDPSA